ncbi:metal-dependent hydrolase [Halomontanus rarus]|uniref:metal-dependent hydrolase n=1 Tax=Halomontanus rarus TaxID=3034020 RepID=UPI001A9A2AAA
MWPLGHLAVAYCCYSLSTRVRFETPPAHVPALVLIFGSQFPDLLDKPFAWYLGILPSGRSLGHSLLVLVPLAVGLSLLARRYGRGEYAAAFAIGALPHSLLDSTTLLWDPHSSEQFLFWPLSVVPIPAVFESSSLPSYELFLLSEFVFAALAYGLWWRDGFPGLEPIRSVFDRDGHTAR